jgi:hypothetical protein
LDLSSNDEDEGCCTDDMVETSDKETSSPEDSSSSGSDSGSDKSDNLLRGGGGAEPERNGGTGFVSLVEQKTMEFVRAKPRPKPNRPSQQTQKHKLPEQNHRQHHTAWAHHFFKWHPPDPSAMVNLQGKGLHN